MDSATEVLFNARVPITIKQPSTTASLSGHQAGSNANDGPSSSAATRLGHQTKPEPVLVQQRRHGITVQISLASRQAGRSKVLDVQLTDETDPFFLYQLDIGEEDFHCLKNEQNLLVDFQAFPVKFIELLEECVRCRNDDHPKYIAQLMSETPSRHSVLSIIETNTFKHIAHLSLNFVPGNDVHVKQYLANLVKEYKSEISSLRMQLETTNTTLLTRLKEQEALARSLGAELENVKMTSSEGSSKLLIQHAEEMSRERERALRDMENLRRETERERRNLEQQYEEQLRNLTQKHTSVSATHSHLISHTQTLESALASANKQLENLTQDNHALRQDFEKTSARGMQLEKEQSEMQREIESLRGKLREYERREREKEDENRRLNDLLENANDQKTKWEDSLNLYKSQNARMEDAFKKATEEINKGNEIIQRLQSELRSLKSKIKLKNIVTLQQEKLLDERAHSMESQQKEINTLKETMTKKQEDLDSAQRHAEDLQKRLDESKQIIEDNGNVIEWLHKQLNDDAIHRPPMSAPSGVGGITGSAYGHIDFDKFAVSTASRTGHEFGGSGDFRRSGIATGSLGYRTRFEDNGVASQHRYAPAGTTRTGGIPQITYRGSVNGAKQRHNLSGSSTSPPKQSSYMPSNGYNAPSPDAHGHETGDGTNRPSPSNAATTSHLNHSNGVGAQHHTGSGPAADPHSQQTKSRNPSQLLHPSTNNGLAAATTTGSKYQTLRSSVPASTAVKSNFF